MRLSEAPALLVVTLYLVVPGMIEAMPPAKYLEKFGFMGENSPDTQIGSLTDDKAFEMALKKFQRRAGIEETGVYDAETKYWMELPRCGNKDEMSMGDVARRKRYAKQGSKWRKNSLTYKIINFSTDLSRTIQRREIRRAFQIWADETPLTFTEVDANANADIELKFARGNHGDNFPFDGLGGTLAHAFFPQFGGDAHMDDDERFTADSYTGTNLFQVLAHELGHSLGLGHSDDRDALMAPFYRGFIPNFRLRTDDILGIQSIYGRPVAGSPNPAPVTPQPPPVTPAPTNSPSLPDICLDGQFDAITRVEDAFGKTYTYVFRHGMYARLNDYGLERGYPRYIRDTFPSLPDNLDAAIFWPEKPGAVARTYFFKGGYYWRYQKGSLVAGYPRAISSGFPGLPAKLDSAFVWSGNGKTYFTRDNQYYRYQRGHGIEKGYPKSLSVWRGLPARVDSAFQWQNGRTYFFNGPNYYRFDDRQFRVDTGYPRLNSIWWLGCPDSNNDVKADMEMSELDDQFIEVDTISGSGSNYRSLSVASLLVIFLTLMLS